MPHKNARNDLSQEYIKSILEYVPETGIFRWKVALARRITIGDVAGVRAEKGRIKIGIKNREYKAHRLAWLYMTGKWPVQEIDHINGKQDDNRWQNLRAASSSENLMNRKVPVNNKSGHKGVFYWQKRKKWIAYIKAGTKRKHIGVYTSKKEAVAAREAAAFILHGKFANEVHT